MKQAIRWRWVVCFAAIMTMAVPPVWGAASAAPDAAAQAISAGYLENVSFERMPGKERVILAVSKQSGVTVENQPGTAVLVKMENLFVPPGLRRPLSDPAMANVIRVTPVQKTEEGRSWVLAEIELKQKVPYSVRQEGMNVLIDFNVTSLPQAAAPAAAKQAQPVKTAAKTAAGETVKSGVWEPRRRPLPAPASPSTSRMPRSIPYSGFCPNRAGSAS